MGGLNFNLNQEYGLRVSDYMSSIPPKNRQHAANGISGLVAGAFGTLVGHPLDTLKVRSQVGDLRQEALPKSIRDFRPTYIRELYRGLLPPLLTAGCTQFMVFTIYEHAKSYLRDQGLSYLQSTFAAATIAGAFTSFVTSPMQLVKTHQQAAATSITVRQCLRSIVGQLGYRGLFHASGSVLAVEGVGRGVYMLLYEYYKMKLSGIDTNGKTNGVLYKDSDVPLWCKVASASAAGSSSWLLMYPLDSIKCRRLSDLSSTSSAEMCSKIYRLGGVRAFYRGCVWAIARSVPVAAVILPLYEFTKGQLAHALGV
ncbi:mitochondrial carrier domain-containing protein [Ochromonadaceae sp. CCMP2298]|nr:mitochondrial carrier domain-containing protein [Ochromonadaceae sp. CCMP2298]